MKLKPSWQLIVLGVLLVWALLAQASYSGFVVYTQLSNHAAVELPFHRTSHLTRTIGSIPPEYQGSGLRKGDEVVALDGQKVEGLKELDSMPLHIQPGETMTVTVERHIGDRTSRLDLPVRAQRPPVTPLKWAIILGLIVFLPLSCLLVGFYIAFARPSDPLAWITMAMLISFGNIGGSGTSWALPSPWRELLFVYHPILSNTWPLWLVLFALYFPRPFPWIARWKWLIWVLAAPPLVLLSLDIYANFEAGAHIAKLGGLAAFEHGADHVITLLFTVYIFGFFFFLGWKGGVLKNPDAKRRLRLMVQGCSLSLVPLFPVVLAEQGVIPAMPAWLTTICLLMLVIFPITMAYVIVVQRAMDVRMVVRLGVRYSVASNGLRLVRLILIIAVAAVTSRLALQSSQRLEAIAIAGVGAAVIIGFRRLASRLSLWMDRRFFRDAYNAEMVLTELSTSVSTIRDKGLLIETVAQRIAAALHIDQIAVLLDTGGRFAPAYSMGFAGSSPVSGIPPESATTRLLARQHSPSQVYFDDPQSWVHDAPASEQTVLRDLNTQVLLPLSIRQRMLGLISLGPKRSEAPYSPADLQLLGAVASQTGLALENAELTENIRHEVAQRERLNRELEIARDVQQRLFPQSLPVVKGLDFAGYCRPAEGVGGDYYDFIRLPNSCLGIAIGDVSGKGIAAALMMASLQASLRGQTIKPSATLSEMIQHINKLVFEASAVNRYATFFYSEYDPNQRTLRYVNAGHNPPILLRRNGSDPVIIRLENGGTVIGLFAEIPYCESQVQLESEDILVAFTDGISEAMDSNDDEFDEARLIQAIEECETRTAADAITYILAHVDAFTAGAPQHDDMTLVVVRVQ